MKTAKQWPKSAILKKDAFNAQAFLDSAGLTRKVTHFEKAAIIFSQGSLAESVMYIQEGGVKITAVSAAGKEAIKATSTTRSTVLVIDRNEMAQVLHNQHELSDLFINFVLTRNIRIEEDLVDQLFNSTEKRLARTLLLLARYGKQSEPQRVLPKVSQETLAEMIGTTRTRVNLFMNKFKKLGFIKYNGGIHINTSLLSVVLHD
jgi:CRP-like cAMP-binding protein